ncbi:MAG: CopD family protein [Gemmatimonadales bacterium]
MSYLWIKVLHLLAVMTWMAGIFYIFRLLAYHARHRAEPATVALLVEMERKMLRIVMLPGASASVALGVLMLWMNPSLLSHRWLHLKLAAVLGMLAYHWYAERAVARFRRGDFFLSEIQSRALHLVPTVLLAIIVAMVVLQSALLG